VARRTASHLSRRGSIYQLRLPIPTDLHEIFGRKELRWSLQTSHAPTAKKLTLRARLVFLSMCSNIRTMPDLSKNIIPTLVQQFYKDLVAVDPTPNNLSVREAERAASEHGRITEEIVDHLQLEIDHHVYSERTVKLAEQTLARNGIGRGDVSKEVFSALCNGVARAELEFTRFLDFRQHEPILPYVPIDPLLTSAPSVISKSTQPEQATGHLIAPNHLLKTSVTTVSSAIDQYIAFKTENEEGGSSAWKSVDVPSKRRPLDWFATLAGPEISISDLALANFRLFRDKIKRLKKNAPAGVDIREHQAKQAEDRIHPKTAKQHFHAVKAFLNWLSAEGLVESDLVPDFQGR